jgi:hypothetical protein
MWGALSDEKTGLSFSVSQSEVISLLSVCTIYILHVIKCMYVQYMHGLCQSRLCTTDHALSLVAPAKTSEKDVRCVAMDVLYYCVFVGTCSLNKGLFTKNQFRRECVYRAVA